MGFDFNPEKNLDEFINFVHNGKIAHFYNEFYLKAKNSQAHAEFCKQVYGQDLCQHGMLDMHQLTKLIETSKLNKDDHVLELGSGIGLITEYISDITQCRITAIDIAAEAVEAANKRVKDKNKRIVFETKDMDNLDYPDNYFDKVIAIDTLYYVKDLDHTIKDILRILKPNGSMYIFYHTHPDEISYPNSNPASCSELGIVLNRLGIAYQTLDLTNENKKHWQLKKQVLLQLQTKFEQEGNIYLFNNRMEECLDNLGDYHRFLYIVECTEDAAYGF